MMNLEDESQAIKDAVREVGQGGPKPTSERIYDLIRVMIEDRLARIPSAPSTPKPKGE